MANSWKWTLKLPNSSFPVAMQSELQNTFQIRCTDQFYKWQTKNRPKENPFVLHDGPPYANGALHVGHALNKILKDMILRVKIQQGRRVIYRPGWDCHGLPIEMKAVQRIEGETFTPNRIRRLAERLASKTVDEQMGQFKSMAVMSDWGRKWTTMDHDFEIRQMRVFQNLVRQGLIYRRHKPVYWSPWTQTALAESELEYEDNHYSRTAYIKFPIVSDWSSIPGLDKVQGPLYASIWTTTPWTLPANKAIAVHKDMSYSVIRIGHAGLLVATDRLVALKHTFPEFDVIAESIRGSDLVGLQYHNKLRGPSSPPQPFIEASFVTADSGTGLVHIAPGHGQDDYEACAKLGIEAFAPVDDHGRYTEEAYPADPAVLQSHHALETGNDKVLELMADDVLRAHQIRHKYPYDWRAKKPVIIRATAQWFADVGSIKDDALEALHDVKFIPEGGRVRLESFIKGRNEWCISRQRSWGLPIPALYDEAGNAVMTPESIEHIITTMEERGVSAWFSDDPYDPAWIAPSLTGEHRRGTDTMDVWFDSGSSWTETDGRADVYLEGSDQHRGWFQSSLLTYVASQKLDKDDSKKIVAPFKTLITHGFTLDAVGKKMSKSIGNIISPKEVMSGQIVNRVLVRERSGKNTKKHERYGPDALRMWAASADFKTDVLIGQDILQNVHVTIKKYRTTLRMLLGILRPENRNHRRTKLDHLALLRLQDTMAQVGRYYEDHEFYRAVSAINHWVSTDFSAFYLEAIKDRLYCGDGGSDMEPFLVGFLRMIAPITPVLVEETWASLPEWMRDEKKESPAKDIYDSPLPGVDDAIEGLPPKDELRDDLNVLTELHGRIKTTLEEGRIRKKMGSSLESYVNLNVKKGKLLDTLERYEDELGNIFVVSSTWLNKELPSRTAWTLSRSARVKDSDVEIVAFHPEHKKCQRCWRHLAPTIDRLCHRCETHLDHLNPTTTKGQREIALEDGVWDRNVQTVLRRR